MYGSANPPSTIFMDPRGKSDFDAGLLFFAGLSRMYPHLTWSDLSNPQFMAGWWTNLKKATTSIRKGIGDTLSSVVNFVGKKGGEAVRLAADPKVADTISRAGAAYATGGMSEGGRGIWDSLSSIFTSDGRQAIEIAGANYKQSYGLDFRHPAMMMGAIGGGVLILVLLLRK